MQRETVERILRDYEAATGLPCAYQGEGAEPAPAPCAFCRRADPGGKLAARCLAQRAAAAEKADREKGYGLFACHAGLVEWVVPVRHQDQPDGWLYSGFVAGAGEGRKRIREQRELYRGAYGLEGAELDALLEEVPEMDGGRFDACARLLAALADLHTGTARKAPPREAPDIRDLVYFYAEDRRDARLTGSLSEYIYQSERDAGEMTAFWKTLEIRASEVFTEVMSGRAVRARALFDEILSLAYGEKDAETAKISAEMLFHIIFLKYYGKDVYDIRFYRLAFETIHRLYLADTIEKIRGVMGGSFDEMYSFYNTGDARGGENRVVQEIMRYVEEHYASKLRVADIAAAVYLSPEYVSRLFKRETTFTVKWYINQVRMKHAQELLLSTRMPVAEIARAVGYEDARGFYKMFAKQFGVTCTEMRKRFTGVNNN